MKIEFAICSIAVFLSACSDPASESIEVETPIPTGEETYMMYCAQCHGVTGDGESLIALDRPARSFIDGGFSFGNTIDAISKTTKSGIPGTPMPPFSEILTPEEINGVALHVRSFAPMVREATPDETEMIVGERPVVVRGMIPPIQDGMQLHPRGLLIGNPDGLSYEYRVDDVRLLAVRQGKFVQRTDWTGRGGTPLKILGRIVVLVDGGNPNEMFTNINGDTLMSKLTSTNVIGSIGEIRYDIVDDKGKKYAAVVEFCEPTTGLRTLVEQVLSIEVLEPINLTVPTSATLDGGTTLLQGSHTRIVTHAARKSE